MSFCLSVVIFLPGNLDLKPVIELSSGILKKFRHCISFSKNITDLYEMLRKKFIIIFAFQVAHRSRKLGMLR